MIEFLYMDGYAPYIWTSYGLTLLLLLINIIIPYHQERNLLRKLTRQLRRKQRDSFEKTT